MPADFERCIKQGGRVRSKRVNKTQYIKVCFLNGKSYAGETHEYKKLTKKKEKQRYKYVEDKRMHAYGDIDEKKKGLIRVNPSKGDVVDTVLHEEMHKDYPDMTEKQVSKKVKEKMKYMSVAKQRDILTKFLIKKKNGRKI